MCKGCNKKQTKLIPNPPIKYFTGRSVKPLIIPFWVHCATITYTCNVIEINYTNATNRQQCTKTEFFFQSISLILCLSKTIKEPTTLTEVKVSDMNLKNKNWSKILIEWAIKYPKSPIVQQSCEMSDMDYTSSTLWTWYSNLLGHGHGNNFVIKRVLTKNTTLPWDQINVHEHGALMRYVYQHNT